DSAEMSDQPPLTGDPRAVPGTSATNVVPTATSTGTSGSSIPLAIPVQGAVGSLLQHSPSDSDDDVPLIVLRDRIRAHQQRQLSVPPPPSKQQHGSAFTPAQSTPVILAGSHSLVHRRLFTDV